MSKLRQLLVWCMLLVSSRASLGQEGSPGEIAKRLDRARQAPAKEAVELLQKSLGQAGETPLTAAERADLAGQFVKILGHHKFTMDQVDKVLAGKSQRRIARQIYYQRYLEHWHVEHPLPFRLVWDCPKGQEPVFRSGTVMTTP